MIPEKFQVLLSEKEIRFYVKDENIVINHQGDVYLRSLTTLPDNVKFENQGYVNLESLTTLPDNVKFENQGDVYLRSLTTLPDNVKFENQGDVNLRSLTTLPDNVKFENQGYVNLESLTDENQTYRGQKVIIKNIDGYTMLLGKKRKAGEATIYKARYFGGGEIEKLKECLLANQGDDWAHGKTAREAIEDVRFKVMSSSFDKNDVLEEISKTQRVKTHHYRLLTGACKEGCRQFLRSKGYEEDAESLPLKDVIALIPGHYGAESALALLNPLLKGGKA